MHMKSPKLLYPVNFVPYSTNRRTCYSRHVRSQDLLFCKALSSLPRVQPLFFFSNFSLLLLSSVLALSFSPVSFPSLVMIFELIEGKKPAFWHGRLFNFFTQMVAKFVRVRIQKWGRICKTTIETERPSDTLFPCTDMGILAVHVAVNTGRLTLTREKLVGYRVER